MMTRSQRMPRAANQFAARAQNAAAVTAGNDTLIWPRVGGESVGVAAGAVAEVGAEGASNGVRGPKQRSIAWVGEPVGDLGSDPCSLDGGESPPISAVQLGLARLDGELADLAMGEVPGEGPPCL